MRSIPNFEFRVTTGKRNIRTRKFLSAEKSIVPIPAGCRTMTIENPEFGLSPAVVKNPHSGIMTGL